ncbi:MAG: TonB family protein [Gemmatimonadetes bacterium]|nr:TonB family protein [Gemmatimonadota bacterium]
MFNKLVASEGKKKSMWSLGAGAASILVHGGLLAGLVAIGVGAQQHNKKKEDLVNFVELKEDKPPPPPPKNEPPPPPPPPKADEPPPVVKGTQELVPPEQPPPDIPKVDPNEHAVNAADFSGQGKLGGVSNGVDNGQAQDVSKRDAPPDEGTYELSAVEEQPRPSNVAEFTRLLERNYPPLLREAGVTGTVQVRMRVEEDGHVDPASITIESTSNDQFGDATKRAVERLRFRPAKVGGRPVKVWVTLPVTWQITH